MRNSSRFTRWLRRLAVALTVLLVVGGMGRAGQIWLESQLTGERGPYLQNPAPTAVTLRWQTEQPLRGEVRYGTGPEALTQQVQEAESTTVHEVRLTGLNPASRYWYAIGSEGQVSQGGNDYWFRTAPQPGTVGHYRFWVQGDPGYYNDGAKAVHQATGQWLAAHPREGRPLFDLWLTTGDNAYTSGRNSEYQRALFDAYPEWLRNIPYAPVYGNHDARRRAFYPLFTFPEQGEGGGVASGSEHYFSLDYGNVHFIVLDSEGSDRSANGAMMTWLKRDLAATSQLWRVVLFHHPPYTRATHDSDSESDSFGRMSEMRETFLPVLEEHGADLVLGGHSHIYERSHLLRCHYGKSDSFTPTMIVQPGEQVPYRKPFTVTPRSGTVYAVVGSSSKIDSSPRHHPAHQRVLQELGSLMIDVNDNRLDARFINSAGQVSDHFAIVKSAEIAASGAACEGQ